MMIQKLQTLKVNLKIMIWKLKIYRMKWINMNFYKRIKINLKKDLKNNNQKLKKIIIMMMMTKIHFNN